MTLVLVVQAKNSNNAMAPLTKPSIEVVAAIIEDSSGAILVAKRALHKHQGGLWEFPGGKVEAGETLAAALQREIDEELGLQIVQAKPFTSLKHVYPEQEVTLHIWHVTEFKGQAQGRENQAIAWVRKQQLGDLDFPQANQQVLALFLQG
jgi:8-oxo-dGTP diphosphatase